MYLPAILISLNSIVFKYFCRFRYLKFEIYLSLNLEVYNKILIRCTFIKVFTKFNKTCKYFKNNVF
jgi:hypothetical protein